MKSIKQGGADACAAIGFAPAECSLGGLRVARKCALRAREASA